MAVPPLPPSRQDQLLHLAALHSTAAREARIVARLLDSLVGRCIQFTQEEAALLKEMLDEREHASKVMVELSHMLGVPPHG